MRTMSIGATSATWSDAGISGSLHWGTLDETGLRRLVSILECPEPTEAGTGFVLADCQEVDRLDGEALLALTTAKEGPFMPWSWPIMARHVVIVPGGIPGFLLAGALPSLVPSCPVRCVRTVGEALRYAQHPEAASAHAAAVAAVSQERNRPALVRQLVLQLRKDLVDATVERTASALRTSVRALQRALQQYGTSFSDELRRARVAAAEELLAHSDAKIDTIAGRVGLGTGSRMNAVLRRELNVTASELRNKVRSGPPVRECRRQVV
jgi:AraC-like DNA-binding protein